MLSGRSVVETEAFSHAGNASLSARGVRRGRTELVNAAAPPDDHCTPARLRGPVVRRVQNEVLQLVRLKEPTSVGLGPELCEIVRLQELRHVLENEERLAGLDATSTSSAATWRCADPQGPAYPARRNPDKGAPRRPHQLQASSRRPSRRCRRHECGPRNFERRWPRHARRAQRRRSARTARCPRIRASNPRNRRRDR